MGGTHCRSWCLCSRSRRWKAFRQPSRSQAYKASGLWFSSCRLEWSLLDQALMMFLIPKRSYLLCSARVKTLGGVSAISLLEGGKDQLTLLHPGYSQAWTRFPFFALLTRCVVGVYVRGASRGIDECRMLEALGRREPTWFSVSLGGIVGRSSVIGTWA